MKNYTILKKIKNIEEIYNENIIEYKILYNKLINHYQKENEFDNIGIEDHNREKNELIIEEIELKLNQIEHEISKYEIEKKGR